MNKGFILLHLMIYVCTSTILCGLVFKSVHYVLNAYQRLNAQGCLVRSMIVGSSLVHRFAISIDHQTAVFQNNTLSWSSQDATHALVLKKNTLWYISAKRKIALMHSVDRVDCERTPEGLVYSVGLKLHDQTLTMQAIL